MKKTIQHSLTARSLALLTTCLVFTFLTSSCSKDDEPTPTPVVAKPLEKSPIMKALLIDNEFTMNATGSGNYEYGLKFQVTQNGKITRLGCKMPTAGTYRVSIWDGSVTPKTVLGSTNVTISAGGTAFVSISSPISLSTGKDYFCTIWSNTNWYQFNKPGGGSITYPMVEGSVKIMGYQWVSSAQTPQTFPTNTDITYIAGLMDFDFQPE